MAEFASQAVGTAGLTTGIIGTVGTAAQLLQGGLGGLLGGLGGNPAGMASAAMQLGDHYVTQKEMQYIQQLNEERNKNAILVSEQNTEIKIADVYERIMTRVNADQRAQADWNAAQSVANAQMSAAIATNNASIAALQSCCSQITKLVVPNTAICPGWGDVKITPAAPTAG